MKKCIAIVPLIFLMIFVVAALTTYDNFDDGDIDTSLWTETNTTDSGTSYFSLSETTNISMGYYTGTGAGSIGIATIQTFSGDFEINWSMMEVTGGAGSANWGACWIQLGDFVVVLYNATASSPTVTNLSSDEDEYNLKYISSSNYELRNRTQLVRTIDQSLDGVLNFSCKGTSDGALGVNMTFDNVSYGLQPPGVTLDSPDDLINTANSTIAFNATQSGGVETLDNSTTYIWYSNGTNFNSTFFELIGSSNSTGVDVDFSTINTYTWGADMCLTNDTCYQSTNRTFTWGIDNLTSMVLNTTEFELFDGNWGIQFDSPASSVTGNFWFNGSIKPATSTYVSGNTWQLNSTFTLKTTDIGHKSMFFEINADGAKYNTTTTNQWINGTIFDQCNNSLTNTYINFTFKNETTAAEDTTAFISSSTWYYYGDNSSYFKSLTFSNATENNWYAFCTDPSSETIKTNVTLLYDNSISEQRSYELSLLTLTNTTLNQTLYLLPTSEGIFVTFQIIDVSEQVINNVFVNVTKGTTENYIASDFSNDAGLVTFFLDPDESYNFLFQKSGYSDTTTTLTPTETSYTITLGDSVTIGNDFTKGIAYHILPINKTLLNETTYTFSFELGSSFWTVDSFGFGIRNSSHSTTLNYSSTNTNGGIVSFTLNTGNHESLIIDAFWTIDNNVTNISDPYFIFDDTGTDYSINNFIDRLKSYLSGDGMFGLKANSFSLALIVYMIIFISVGIVSFKFGININSSTGIIFLLFSLVYLFDVVFGLIPNIVGTSKNLHAPTIIAGMLLIATIIRNATK